MIFDVNKTAEEYSNVNLFGNSDDGIALVDTINKRFQKIWDLYKEMRSLDWSEDEFDHSQTLVDFERVQKDTCDVMLEMLMFQWETDSVASQVPFALIAPYGPCMEIIAAELRINENECVHASTYSEIIKMSFKDPHDILKEMLKHKHTHERLTVVGKVLYDLKQKSNALAYYGPTHFTELEKTEHMILFFFAMYVLERLQFMASFGVTFTICESGIFQSIGNAVKKICQDEYEVHSEYRLEVINQLLMTELGPQAFKNVRHTMIEILKEAIQADVKFSHDLFKNGQRSIVGLNEHLLIKWSLFNAKVIARNFSFTEDELGLNDGDFPENNPLPHLENWIDINKNQTANQETNNISYKVNTIDFNDADKVYEI